MKKGSDPIFRVAAKYTGQAGLLTSPMALAVLSWRFTEAHRVLSERGIIATKRPPSTLYANFLKEASNGRSKRSSGASGLALKPRPILV